MGKSQFKLSDETKSTIYTFLYIVSSLLTLLGIAFIGVLGFINGGNAINECNKDDIPLFGDKCSLFGEYGINYMVYSLGVVLLIAYNFFVNEEILRVKIEKYSKEEENDN